MAGKNTGVSYESLTQGFFQAILDQDSVKNVRVERNVKLGGRSTVHQVDVFWSFEVAGVAYHTVVQCKDWNSRVKQEQVLAFSAVLDDIPGQPRGILVSKDGFQSGAESVAKAHGIALYRLREADEDYWAGRIKKIGVTMNLVVPAIGDVRLGFDSEWLKMRKEALGLEAVALEYSGNAGEMELVDDSGAPVGTIANVLLEALPKDGKPHPLERREVTFAAPTYLLVPACQLSPLKLLGIQFEGGQTILKSEMLIDGEPPRVHRRLGYWSPAPMAGFS